MDNFNLTDINNDRTTNQNIKLFGRETEITLLENIFEVVCDGHFELLFIKGISGTGKTTLINKTFSSITYKRGFFISGKFDHYKRDEPYVPFIQAFTNMIDYILTESKEKVDSWKKLLKNVLGKNSGIIATMIPEIELILGPQKMVEESDPEKNRRRFERVFIKFIQAFASKEQPMVLFLDDLQWADVASMNLIKAISQATNNEYLLIIGSYREEEVHNEHSLMLLINELISDGSSVKNSTLKNLNLSNTYDFVATYLNCSKNQSKEIADIIYKKTLGNPFYIKKMLELLSKEKLLLMDEESNNIRFDRNYIEKIDHSNQIIDLIIERIKKELHRNLYLVKFIACIGHSFALKTFAIVYNNTMMQSVRILSKLVEENILLPTLPNSGIIPIEQFKEMINKEDIKRIHFEFAHDKIYEATYKLVQDMEKRKIHLHIGRALLKNLRENDLKEDIINIMSHINYGLTYVEEQEEKIKLAHLNYLVGKKAKNTCALISAQKFFESGLQLLSENKWHTNYQLTYKLYFELSQCIFLSGNIDGAEVIYKEMFENIKTDIEKAKIYKQKTILYTCISNYEKAIEAGVKALSYINIKVSDKHNFIQLLREIIISLWVFRNKRLDKLLDLPETKSVKTLMALEILIQLAPAANFYNKDLFTVILLKLANISAIKGDSKYSPCGYASYSIFLGSIFRNYTKAHRLELNALEISNKYNDQSLNSIMYFIISTFVTHWTSHGNISLKYGYKSLEIGIESGEIFFAGYTMTSILEMKHVLGKKLDEISKDCSNFYSYAKSMDFEIILDLTNMFQKFIKVLKDENIKINQFISVDLEKQMIDKKSNEIMTYYILSTQLQILVGDYKKALEIATISHKKINSIIGFIMYVEHTYYYSLAITLSYEELSTKEKKKYIKKLKKNQKMLKKWAYNCPENFLHKYLLVRAEIARVNKKDADAMRLYDEAIKSANENGFIQNEAMINELTARYYKAIGREKVAILYIKDACNKYNEWGATAKATQLINEWDSIYIMTNQGTKIIQQNENNINKKVELIKPSEQINRIMAIYKEMDKETSNSHIMLEFLKGVIEITGADKVYILIEEEEQLYIQAYKESYKEPFQTEVHVLLEKSEQLPKRVIRYVARTNETLILEEDMFTGVFSKEPYIMDNRPSTIACTPLMFQKILFGVLYIEINMTTEVFSSPTIESLKILSHKLINSKKLRTFTDNHQKSIESNKRIIELLTVREREVLTLIALGKSNKEIARDLNLSISTIKTHLINLYSKLGVNKRIQAVIKGKELGLIKE